MHEHLYEHVWDTSHGWRPWFASWRSRSRLPEEEEAESHDDNQDHEDVDAGEPGRADEIIQ
jgi:hypothetical protein